MLSLGEPTFKKKVGKQDPKRVQLPFCLTISPQVGLSECINFDQIFKDILLKFKQRQFILKDNINNAWKYHFDLFRQNQILTIERKKIFHYQVVQNSLKTNSILSKQQYQSFPVWGYALTRLVCGVGEPVLQHRSILMCFWFGSCQQDKKIHSYLTSQ